MTTPVAEAPVTGMLSILNTGEGDIEVRFTDASDDEVDRAVKMLRDMQDRGYAIMVRLEDGSHVRAQSIDAKTREYVIKEETRTPGSSIDLPSKTVTTKRAPIRKSTAVGIGRSAGG